MALPHPITLTFDNGPEPGVTEHVLDVLAARGISATFFVIGRKLTSRSGQALVTRARAEGHVIGNHSFFHLTPLGEASPEAAAHEIGATQELLGDLSPERLFRPVGDRGRLGPHLLSPAARDLLMAGRYTCALWNALPRDWDDPEAWLGIALGQIAAHRRSFTPTVMALHDLPAATLPHLPAFLDRLAETDVVFTQHFPDEVVIIREGRPSPQCERYVSASVESLAVG